MRVLSVVHDPSLTGGGGLFEDLVARQGHRLDRWVAPNGGAPDPPDSYDAIMVFGGVQHPDEDENYPWLQPEVHYIAAALEATVPFIGVCLGSQLLARAAGGSVGPAPAAEIGWHGVELTEAGRADPLLGELPERLDAFQWHYYTFGVPEGATTLATSPVATQAFRIGDTAWGIQFHAEVTRQMLDEWFVEGADQLPKPLPEIRAETDRHLGPWNEAGRRICNAFLDQAVTGSGC